jgi:hypothetical protein
MSYDYWKFGYDEDDTKYRARRARDNENHAMICESCGGIDNSLTEGDDCVKCESGIMKEIF